LNEDFDAAPEKQKIDLHQMRMQLTEAFVDNSLIQILSSFRKSHKFEFLTAADHTDTQIDRKTMRAMDPDQTTGMPIMAVSLSLSPKGTR
jgi:hypothetical protein